MAQGIVVKFLKRKPGDQPFLDIVLAQVTGFQPYVTWVHNLETDSYHHGHYYLHYSDALADFQGRDF